MEDYRIIPIGQGRLVYFPVIVAPVPQSKKRQGLFAYLPPLPFDPDGAADQDPIVSEED